MLNGKWRTNLAKVTEGVSRRERYSECCYLTCKGYKIQKGALQIQAFV